MDQEGIFMNEAGSEKIGSFVIFSEGFLKPYPYEIIKFLTNCFCKLFFEKVSVFFAAEGRGDWGYFQKGRDQALYLNPYPEEIEQLPDIMISRFACIFYEKFCDIGGILARDDFIDLAGIYFLRPEKFWEKSENGKIRDIFMQIKRVFKNYDFSQERKILKEKMDEYLKVKDENEWRGLEENFDGYCNKGFDRVL